MTKFKKAEKKLKELFECMQKQGKELSILQNVMRIKYGNDDIWTLKSNQEEIDFFKNFEERMADRTIPSDIYSCVIKMESQLSLMKEMVRRVKIKAYGD